MLQVLPVLPCTGALAPIGCETNGPDAKLLKVAHLYLSPYSFYKSIRSPSSWCIWAIRLVSNGCKCSGAREHRKHLGASELLSPSTEEQSDYAETKPMKRVNLSRGTQAVKYLPGRAFAISAHLFPYTR